MIVTGRAGILALLCVPVILLSPRPWPTFWILLAGLVAALTFDVARAANPRSVRVLRDGPESLRLGEPARTSVRLNNSGRRLRGYVRDAWPPSSRAAPREHRIDVWAASTGTVGTALSPVRRGDQNAAAVTVRAVGPLGLAGRQADHPAPWQIRVLPPFLSRKHLPARLARLREIDGATPVIIRGQGSEFDSLREYVPGDDVRSIDWRATARRADVVVRTWRPERDREVLIVLDTSRASAGRVGVDPLALDESGWPRLDWSMDAALLLAALASRAGDKVDFLAYDRAVRAFVRGANRVELLPQLVNAMAPLEPNLVELDAAGLVSTVLRDFRHRRLVVILTDIGGATLESSLLEAVPLLTARHQVLVAAATDPRVLEMIEDRGRAIENAYTAASAERHLADRRTARAALLAHGVGVVDAAPEELAPALADRYLALKISGTL